MPRTIVVEPPVQITLEAGGGLLRETLAQRGRAVQFALVVERISKLIMRGRNGNDYGLW